MSLIRAGALLLATPELVDPNFADTVVLLLDADEEGALGVVVNRPSPVPVADVLADYADLVDEPGVLFRGGPVGLDGALGVGRVPDPGEIPVGVKQVAGELGLVDLDTPAEVLRGSLSGLRIYAGYAGWGPGQLESEVAEGSWYVLAGLPGDVFAADVADLWREVLRRQPGELAWHSTRPVDPELN